MRKRCTIKFFREYDHFQRDLMFLSSHLASSLCSSVIKLVRKLRICMPTLPQKYEVTRVLPNIEHCFIVSHLIKQRSQCIFISTPPQTWGFSVLKRARTVCFSKSTRGIKKSDSSKISTNHSLFREKNGEQPNSIALLRDNFALLRESIAHLQESVIPNMGKITTLAHSTSENYYFCA